METGQDQKVKNACIRIKIRARLELRAAAKEQNKQRERGWGVLAENSQGETEEYGV